MAWNPDQYLKFADHRTRPAVELLARIDAAAPGLVYDLGCGPGNATRLLRARWGDARIVGVDSSASMLDKARKAMPELEWAEADLEQWRPDRPAGVIFSNAALHWLRDHDRLFPALLDALAPGGTLAVQMPRNHASPSHSEMRAAAREGPWRARLESLLREAPVAAPERYYDLLSGGAARIDIWETEYLQVLEGEDAVVQWTLGTALKPLVDALDEPWRGRFLADYAARMRAAYPRRPDGRTLFPFRRLFIVAARG